MLKSMFKAGVALAIVALVAGLVPMASVGAATKKPPRANRPINICLVQGNLPVYATKSGKGAKTIVKVNRTKTKVALTTSVKKVYALKKGVVKDGKTFKFVKLGGLVKPGKCAPGGSGAAPVPDEGEGSTTPDGPPGLKPTTCAVGPINASTDPFPVYGKIFASISDTTFNGSAHKKLTVTFQQVTPGTGVDKINVKAYAIDTKNPTDVKGLIPGAPGVSEASAPRGTSVNGDGIAYIPTRASEDWSINVTIDYHLENTPENETTPLDAFPDKTLASVCGQAAGGGGAGSSTVDADNDGETADTDPDDNDPSI